MHKTTLKIPKMPKLNFLTKIQLIKLELSSKEYKALNFVLHNLI